jgi:hypothetical protein
VKIGLTMLQVRIYADRIRIGERFSVSFQRTLRVPDDGREYPLPPGLGAFPICAVRDYTDRVPHDWLDDGGAFIPLYQREALWLGFDGADWKPNAVQVHLGRVNVVTGGPWEEGLRSEPQNYVVCPDQPWLDGIKVGDRFVRQFVAVPLGSGYSVEAQLTGSDAFGGVQITVFEPRPGRFPDAPPPERAQGPMVMESVSVPAGGMALGAGGRITQKLYPDPYGIDVWDPANTGSVTVHLVNTRQYRSITEREPPPSPIDAGTYTSYGFPWFALYDEHRGDVPASDRLGEVESVGARDARLDPRATPDASLDIGDEQVRKLRIDPDRR